MEITNNDVEKRDTMGVSSDELFNYILYLAKLPYPTICRHKVALDLLSMMEKCNIHLPDGLVEAISCSSEGDEIAENILKKLI
jgi:hypothetical protein